MNDIESRLNALGLTIPTPARSVANYVGWTTTGNLIFTAGQLALVNGKLNYPGIVGGDVDIETAKPSMSSPSSKPPARVTSTASRGPSR
jgi:YjgF/chorismate_mutase-like, putative endoribonuclease